MTEHTEHPFRDSKAKPSRVVKNVALHSPCRRCFADCTPPERSNAKTGIVTFRCACGAVHITSRNEARRHTTWLFTRGRANVQAAVQMERA